MAAMNGVTRKILIACAICAMGSMPAVLAADARVVKLIRPAVTAASGAEDSPTSELAALVAEHFDAVQRLQQTASAPRVEHRRPGQMLVRQPTDLDNAAMISARAYPQSTFGGLLATLLTPAAASSWIVADARR
jgi:hypothetical protein